MKFTTELNKKAWAIYHDVKALHIKKGYEMTKEHLKLIRKHAFKVAVKYFTAIAKGFVSFFKDVDGEVEIETRPVMSFEQIGYVPKGTRKRTSSLLLKFVDFAKLIAGDERPFITVKDYCIC